jgi:hypothetical protein
MLNMLPLRWYVKWTRENSCNIFCRIPPVRRVAQTV